MIKEEHTGLLRFINQNLNTHKKMKPLQVFTSWENSSEITDINDRRTKKSDRRE